VAESLAAEALSAIPYYEEALERTLAEQAMEGVSAGAPEGERGLGGRRELSQEAEGIARVDRPRGLRRGLAAGIRKRVRAPGVGNRGSALGNRTRGLGSAGGTRGSGGRRG